MTVRRGEFIALLGPSGCGKSTALNCIAGLLPLTGGGIWLDEQQHRPAASRKQRGFGMVFQNYALFPHMSVRQQRRLRPRMQRPCRGPRATRKSRRRSRSCASSDQGDKLPGQLSGGQQQRVAIARAIVIEPPLVLMDEPLSNLDAKLRLEMRAEIRRIHAIGSTTIYVTHDQEEALSLADRIVVLAMAGAPGRHAGGALYRPPHRDVAGSWAIATLPGSRVAGAGEGGQRRRRRRRRSQGMPMRAGRRRQGAVVAIRPDDLAVDAGRAAIEATVVIVEYRGSDFYCLARKAGGIELYLPLARRGRRRATRVGSTRRPTACWSIRAGRMSVGAGTAPTRRPLRTRLASASFDGVTLLVAAVGPLHPRLSSSTRSSTASSSRSSPKAGGSLANYRQLLLRAVPLQDNRCTTLQLAVAGHDGQHPACRCRSPSSVRLMRRQRAPNHHPGPADHPRHGAGRRGPAQLSRAAGLAQPRAHPASADRRSRCAWSATTEGVFISLVIIGFPFTFLLTLSYVTGIDPVARAGGGDARRLCRGQHFRRIFLPLVAPGLAISSLPLLRAGLLRVPLRRPPRRSGRRRRA